MTTIRLAGPLETDSIVNGPGLRAVLWVQGCPIRCPGCQNPEAWEFDGGTVVDIEDVKRELSEMRGQAGLTFCGGEPTYQAAECLEIARFVKKELGWNVWSFTGRTYEWLKEQGGVYWEFVKSLDALIDGPFILAQRDLTVKFRGSRNQRILHLKNGEIVAQE